MVRMRDLPRNGAQLLSRVLALVLLGEAAYAVLVNPQDYYFSSESMVGRGGWKYRPGLHYLIPAARWSSAG